jgi:hypothetical protein
MDDFNNGAVDAIWYTYSNDGASIEEAGGEVLVHLPDQTTPDTHAGLVSAAQYDITGCHVFLEVTGLPDPATNAYTSLAVGSNDSYVEVVHDSGTIMAKRNVNGDDTYLIEISYDPAQHHYWRIREGAGWTFWELSPDAQSWTELASEPTVIPLSAVNVGLGAGTYLVEPSPPGMARFDNLNVAP